MRTFDEDEMVHPRPRMARDRWIDLGEAGGFAYEDTGRGLDEGWHGRADVYTRSTIVPVRPESPASGIGDPSFHPIARYRRTFTFAPEDVGKHLLLHCGAVDYRAHVWVNDKYRGLVGALLDSPAIAGFCDTQLTDTGQGRTAYSRRTGSPS